MKNIEKMSLKELIDYRQYLRDVSLDGNNGEGDDGLEKYEECNRIITLVDAQIEKLKGIK